MSKANERVSKRASENEKAKVCMPVCMRATVCVSACLSVVLLSHKPRIAFAQIYTEITANHLVGVINTSEFASCYVCMFDTQTNTSTVQSIV